MESYFDPLPYEMHLKILSHLSGGEIINSVSVIPALEPVSYDKYLIRNISLYNIGRLDNLNFLTHIDRRELITSLNITGVYWIVPSQLTDAISQLVNLNCLYTIGTQFGRSTEHFQILNSLPQLTSLSLSGHPSECTEAHKLPNRLVKFCLHIQCRKSSKFLLHQVKKSKKLKELWIIELSVTQHWEQYLKDLTINKLVFCTPERLVHAFPRTLTTFLGCNGQSIFETNTGNKFRFKIYNSWDFTDPDWEDYIEISYLKYLPFCLTDARKLMSDLIFPSELEYSELNLKHLGKMCEDLTPIVCLLLMRENMRKLKKLSVNLCICRSKNRDLSSSKHCKIPRLDLPNHPPLRSPFQDIVINCPLIKELEIWECRSNDSRTSFVSEESILCIGELKNLEKLLLNDFPTNLQGTTLVTLCSKLPKLTSLKIRSIKHHPSLTQGICESITCLPLLRDLRYEQLTIDLNTFFNFACERKDLKLERLVLKSNKAEYDKENRSLDRFLTSNQQLRFLFINIRYLSEFKCLMTTVEKYKTLWKAYFVKIGDVELDPLLIIDNWEMVNHLTAISVLNPFTDHSKDTKSK